MTKGGPTCGGTDKEAAWGVEAENLLICQMRSAGSRTGNTSCGSLKL